MNNPSTLPEQEYVTRDEFYSTLTKELEEWSQKIVNSIMLGIDNILAGQDKRFIRIETELSQTRTEFLQFKTELKSIKLKNIESNKKIESLEKRVEALEVRLGQKALLGAEAKIHTLNIEPRLEKLAKRLDILEHKVAYGLKALQHRVTAIDYQMQAS